jgi:hypothetical protein
MDRLKKHEDELDFFTLELQSRQQPPSVRLLTPAFGDRPLLGSSLPIYPWKLAANQMFPSLSAASP